MLTPTPSPNPYTTVSFWVSFFTPVAVIVTVFIPQVHASNYVQAAAVIVAGLWVLVLTLLHGKGSLGQRIMGSLTAIVTFLEQVVGVLPTKQQVDALEARITALESKTPKP